MSIKKHSGFTLIEVMIAMAILAVLSILTAQTMRAGIQDRDTVSAEISRESKVADALRIIRNDINSAYHYRDIYVTIMNNAAKPDPKPTPANGQPQIDPTSGQPIPPQTEANNQPVVPGSAEAAATPRPTPAVTTGFVGDSESIYFSSLSNVRTVQDEQTSDQAKIGYFVKSCQAHTGTKTGPAKCLYRAVSPFLDENIDRPGQETVLLEHVEQFKLRYLGPGHDDLEYVDSWKTGKNGDATTKDNFPYAVEVTLATDNKDDKKSQKVVASALIPIRFPNNPPAKKAGAQGGADATTQPNSSFNPNMPPKPPSK